MKITKNDLKTIGAFGGGLIGGFAIGDLIQRYRAYKLRKKIEKATKELCEGLAEALKNYESKKESEEEAE